jgi:protein TonB
MRQPAQFASGFVVHLALGLLLIALLGQRQMPPTSPQMTKALVWSAVRPGYEGGGRGGDGVKASPAPRPNVEPQERFTLPRMPAVIGSLELPGTAILSAAGVAGTGADTGPLNGRGEGIDGPGSGRRDGLGSGDGDGPFIDGAPGVQAPRLISEKRPDYTAQAMAAKVEGSVLLEATVLADGSVGNVRVLRSLDERFGLDQKAIEAVRAWRFRPGTYLGRPAAVKVLIELSFNLR